MTTPARTADARRCAAQSRERCDPLTGSASPVQRWFLVEIPGPWGPDAVRGSRLDGDLGDQLISLCARHGVRVLAIRRPGREPARATRRWAWVDSRLGSETVRWGEVHSDPDLLSIPQDGSAGVASSRPVILVCTHAKHDLCCAVDGRPVAAALAQRWPEETWECSHIGGDRFAANMLLLPHGLYYGRVDSSSAPTVVQAYHEGRVVTRYLRGRSSLPPPVQSAQHQARVVLGEERLSALAPVQVTGVDGRWLIRLRGVDSEVRVSVRTHELGPIRATCRATREAPVPLFAVESLTVVPAIADPLISGWDAP